jgi:hypothetical protein
VIWTPAPCGVTLSKELDEVYGAERPNDGTVGDLAHSARASDHNPKQPRPPGWVDARDIYDWRDLDADRLMHALAAGRERRILYVISHGRMCSSYPTSKHPAWTWRPYSGPNGHFSHGHISFRPEHRHDRSTWLTPAVRAALGLTPAPAIEEDEMETIGPGSNANVVSLLQRCLITEARASGRADGNPLPRYGADGDYGNETKAAVEAYQRGRIHTSQLGIAGGVTLALLLRYEEDA